MSNRLYVGNLAFHTTEDVIQRAFAEHGEVAEVKLVLDRETGRSRGFGFVEMDNPAEAENAMRALNGTDLRGRTLVVNEAKPREDRPRTGGGGGFGGGRSSGGYGGQRTGGGYGGNRRF